ncbi:bifunctional pyr operon transcriptional regulator/uracil phosphoribosyltransferase PyrR [Erysipelothrix sp. strain 2 (EsS2-6-Brazil)]|uniref:bifunctional pyr operon transcriptional regulator/uracil phosphoribosyltransferase PyrR n=1 Tax=Erysipelothrix sp. strain 2 (EsS2-6-Brazil) TaxID=2500549 RepID=UPI001D4D63C6|nr:bifunctional pyr operon transcriptional regulator/uracil phosphoribosyltransferase PyrR [Erysipelothrix sp. strain 2 (EsS2-6-Brazil)]MBK2402254.1 bifunctional pyr operon transcriptional regulator/uracil phosphoribosyltransferase PyrR [Erysipelothrix sp. strain 2 (EsS2-6-Brazil)]
MTKMIMNQEEIQRAMNRIAFEILERFHGVESVVLVGIETRGIDIATRIQKKLESIEGPVECISLNIHAYRDDVRSKQALKRSDSLTQKHVVIVDDVLFTGRSVRSSMDAIIDLGRPASISLAVLIDRGHRELPISADFIGKNIPSSLKERIYVQTVETDGIDRVVLETT